LEGVGSMNFFTNSQNLMVAEVRFWTTFFTIIRESVVLSVQPELEADDRAVDTFDRERQDHVEDEKLSL
jgi:ASC-1-like (ASCH) protein